MSVDKIELPMLDSRTLKPALNPILVVDGSGLEKAKAYLSTPREYVLDYETNVVDTFYQRKARTIQFGDKDQQFIVDLLAFADGSEDKLWAAQGGYRLLGVKLRKWWEETEVGNEGQPVVRRGYNLVDCNPTTLQPVFDLLNPSLDSDAWLKIGHNLEFEYIVSKWCLGIRTWHFYDTLIAERLLHNGAVPAMMRDFYGLDDLVARYFKFQIDKSSQTTFDLKTSLTDKQIEYAALDIRLPWALKAMQQPRIANAKIGWTVQIENDAVPAFGDMHLNGLYVNPAKWQTIIDDNEVALITALKELDSHFIPLVGSKVLPNPELVATAHAAFKLEDEPTTKEKDIALQIKQAQKDKNTELKAQLVVMRDELQEQRKTRKAKAKEYHKSISYLATKGYADDVAKMRGDAAINYGSADQVKAALYSGSFGLNEKNLADLDAKTTLMNHMHLPIIKALVNYKKIRKQLETYGYRWITTRDQIARGTNKKHGFVDPDTGRIHPPFRQLGTDTGRPSCSDPNILNLPKESKFRESFEARDGYMNVTKDCSGQELRIVTQISKEPSWIEAFLAKQDVHSKSAHLIRKDMWQKAAVLEPTLMIVEGKGGKKEEKLIPPCAYFTQGFKKCKCPKHEEIRGKFKAVNFGIAYDKQAYSLSVELGISQDEAQEILDEWKKTFKITQQALEKLRNDAYAKGEARTLSGRRRLLSEVTMEQAMKKAEERYGKGNYNSRHLAHVKEGLVAAVKREGGNMPIQGTGADMMKLAMGCGFDPNGNPYLWHIVRELEEKYGVDTAMLLNYVYDEFLYECIEALSEFMGGPNGLGGAVSDAIIRAGAQFVTVVPMDSEGAIAKTWTK